MIRLVQTCSMCPEQYDAYDGDQKVGYLRLRHGRFSVDVPDHNGVEVYTASPQGDGSFEYDERDYYLRFAVDAIQKWQKGELESRPKAPDVAYTIEGDT